MKWIKLGFIVLVFILCFVVVMFTKTTETEVTGSMLGLGLAKILAGLAILATIALVVKNLLNNPKGAIRIGIGLLVMVIVFFIGKGMDAGETYMVNDVLVESGTSKNVGGLLFVTYALGIIGAIAFVGALVMSVFKK